MRINRLTGKKQIKRWAAAQTTQITLLMEIIRANRLTATIRINLPAKTAPTKPPAKKAQIAYLAATARIKRIKLWI